MAIFQKLNKHFAPCFRNKNLAITALYFFFSPNIL